MQFVFSKLAAGLRWKYHPCSESLTIEEYSTKISGTGVALTQSMEKNSGIHYVHFCINAGGTVRIGVAIEDKFSDSKNGTQQFQITSRINRIPRKPNVDQIVKT